jgi:hypothetical protein
MNSISFVCQHLIPGSGGNTERTKTLYMTHTKVSRPWPLAINGKKSCMKLAALIYIRREEVHRSVCFCAPPAVNPTSGVKINGADDEVTK